MDTPVGNYSSGMFARLGFSVAVNVDCDVFIADEVLAVGDQPFKKKCMKKMEEIRDSGVTLFYVSHAAQSVRKMCTRVIVLEKGVVGFDGDVDEGIKYLHYDDDDDVDPDASSAPRSTTQSRSAASNRVRLGRCSDADRPRSYVATVPRSSRNPQRAWSRLSGSRHPGPTVLPTRLPASLPGSAAKADSSWRAHRRRWRRVRDACALLDKSDCRRVDWQLQRCSYSVSLPRPL